MRYERHVRVFRGQLDALPLAGTLLLLLILLLLHSSFVFTTGLPIQLPEAADMAGITNATVTLAVDSRGRCYFQNQLTTEPSLRDGLRQVVARSRGPVTLVLMADRSVPNEVLVRLVRLAQTAGIHDALLATRPAPTGPPVAP